MEPIIRLQILRTLSLHRLFSPLLKMVIHGRLRTRQPATIGEHFPEQLQITSLQHRQQTQAFGRLLSMAATSTQHLMVFISTVQVVWCMVGVLLSIYRFTMSKLLIISLSYQTWATTSFIQSELRIAVGGLFLQTLLLLLLRIKLAWPL